MEQEISRGRGGRGGHRGGRGGRGGGRGGAQQQQHSEEDKILDQFATMNLKDQENVDLSTSVFAEFGIIPDLQGVLILNDINKEPTDVQKKCLPVALRGGDLFCGAGHGHGKRTICAIALINEALKRGPPGGALFSIVVVSKKAAADELGSRVAMLCTGLPIAVAILHGGKNHPLEQQAQMLNQTPPNIIIGTPGRIKTLFEQQAFITDDLKQFVLFNAEDFFGPDFLQLRSDMQFVFVKTPRNKQVMIFSSVPLSPDARARAFKFLKPAPNSTEPFEYIQSK